MKNFKQLLTGLLSVCLVVAMMFNGNQGAKLDREQTAQPETFSSAEYDDQL